MRFDTYAEAAATTRTFPEDVQLAYAALGIAGEGGEVVEIIKKHLRHGGKPHGLDLTPKQVDRIVDEMGDVLWYLAALAGVLGVSFDHVARANLHKLAKRYG